MSRTTLAKRPAEKPPGAGAYLTDGKRLCQVIGLAQDGVYFLEDCRLDIGIEAETIRVTAGEMVGWKRVAASA